MVDEPHLAHPTLRHRSRSRVGTLGGFSAATRHGFDGPIIAAQELTRDWQIGTFSGIEHGDGLAFVDIDDRSYEAWGMPPLISHVRAPLGACGSGFGLPGIE